MLSFAPNLAGTFASFTAWMAMFWFSVSAILYTYAGYPALLWTVSRFRKSPPPPPSSELFLTLLITAHNEAANIGRKLQESLALHYPSDRLQILVASDGSTDDTVAIVQSFASAGVELVAIPDQGGKTAAQNLAVQHAIGDVIVFSDATTEYHPDALQYLAGNFADHTIGAVSGHYVYSEGGGASFSGRGARAFAAYDNRLREFQSSVDSITGCCGCIYAVRRSLYTPLAAELISDLVEPLHVLLQGFRVKFESRALARERATTRSGTEFAMRVRVVTRALQGLYSVKRLLVVWKHPWIASQIISHKLLRYAAPLFLLTMLLASLKLQQSTLYRGILLFQLVIYGMALAGLGLPKLRRLRIFSIPSYFCILNAAALCGIMQFLRGQHYTTWSPQREPSHAN